MTRNGVAASVVAENKEPGMFTVEVTQYMRPDGHAVLMHTDIRDSFEAPYRAIRMRGWRLAAEHLIDGAVSLAVEDDEQDFACEIVANGPEVQPAIERLIAAAICVPPEPEENGPTQADIDDQYGCDCGWGGYCEWCHPEMFDAGREFTPSEAEAIHRAMVRESAALRSCEDGRND